MNDFVCKLIMNSASTIKALTLPIASLAILTATASFAAAPKAASVFADNMVLQREASVPVWGEAPAGSDVSVSFNGQTKTVTTNDQGKWRVDLDPMKAGGPFEMVVASKDEDKAVFKNVLIGDVWICAGQSNMARSLSSAKDAKKEIAAANHPQIRLFNQLVKSTREPVGSCKYNRRPWKICAPESARGFSAVGYFFGRTLHDELNVPIGLMEATLGGTPIQLWISRDFMEREPESKELLDQFKKMCEDPELPKKMKAYEESLNKKKTLMKEVPKTSTPPWAKPSFNDSSWTALDTAKSTTGGTRCALLEMRKTIDIPKEWAGKDLIASMRFLKSHGTSAAVFLNGHKAKMVNQRKGKDQVDFIIDGKAVTPGPATLATRIFCVWRNAKWDAELGESTIGPKDAPSPIVLSGDWRVNTVDQFDYPKEPINPNNRRRAVCGLYNGIINPLAPYTIKGVIWYQGESNAANGILYRTLMPLLIDCWRTKWGQGDFPFLITQIANLGQPPAKPTDSTWADLREAQAMTAANTPNCGLAVTIDVGEANDIHPKNKRPVGERLALAARKIAYGQDVVHSGPTYKSMNVENGKIRLSFDNVGSGLVAKGGQLKPFAIAGEDGNFVWAKANIDGDDVIVWSDAVKAPTAVRYGWAKNPGECTLWNKENLPAVPFRTDAP